MDLRAIHKKGAQIEPYLIVVTEIMDLIETGALLPGENLPTDKALSEQLSVPTEAVNEAYQLLENEGLVNIRLNSGAFLALTTRDLMLDRIRGSILHIDNSEIVQLLEIRKSLEILAIGQAIDFAKEDDLRLIQEKLIILEDRVSKHRIATREDLEFHFAIVKASRNPMLIDIMTIIFERFYQSLKVTRESIRRLERVDHFVEEHKKIYQAIIEHDKETAIQLIDQHLTRTIGLYPDAFEYRNR